MILCFQQFQNTAYMIFITVGNKNSIYFFDSFEFQPGTDAFFSRLGYRCTAAIDHECMIFALNHGAVSLAYIQAGNDKSLFLFKRPQKNQHRKHDKAISKPFNSFHSGKNQK